MIAEKNKIVEIMQSGIQLEVPSMVDCEVGASWGEVG